MTVVEFDMMDRALAAASDATLLVETEHSAVPRGPQATGWWRREPGAVPPPDLSALDWVRHGSVLDVGCSTGRHLELLADRGVHGHGIDISPVAIDQARAAGLSCEVADWNSYAPPDAVDTVLLMGGNGGLARELALLPGVLTRLASWLRPGGAIVFTSVDWTRLPELVTGPGRPERPYPGEVRLRFHLDDRTGDWFRWLFVDPDALAAACAEAGLRIVEQQHFGAGPPYGALLVRNEG